MDKWLNHPTVLKLVAVALAIIMWAVVHFDPENPPNQVASLEETRQIEDVLVTVVGLDERNYRLEELQPQKVRLTVRGTRNDLLAARPEDYRLEVDVSEVQAGQHTLSIRAAGMPRGVRFIQADPGSVMVTLSAMLTKEFEAIITTTGEPAAGFRAGTPIVTPTGRVHVTLPEADLSRVVKVGAVVSIDGADETVKVKRVALAAYDANGEAIEDAILDPPELQVEIPITSPYKTVPLQVRFQGEMPAGLSIASFKPEVEQVTVYGPQAELDRLSSVEAVISMSELRSSGKVTVPLAADAQLLEIVPSEVTVNVEVVLSGTRSLTGLPITWSGLGAGLEARIVQPAGGKADITLSGAPSVIDRLQPGDITVIADLSGRGPGTYTIPLVVQLRRFVEQTGGTSTVTVEIFEAAPASATPGDGGEAGEGEETEAPADETGATESASPESVAETGDGQSVAATGEEPGEEAR